MKKPNTTIIMWKWSNYECEPPERTPIKRQINHYSDELDHPSEDIKVQELKENAYSLSLHHDENTWDMLNVVPGKTAREISVIKMADRHNMIGQGVSNPFFMNNNYIQDIINQNRFLKPVSLQEGETETENKPTPIKKEDQ